MKSKSSVKLLVGSNIDIETVQEKHQGELLALETQLRDEMDELIARYESETAVKQALHDQVAYYTCLQG